MWSDPAIPLPGIYPEKPKAINLKRYKHSSVHSSTIYNSQDMGETKMSIHRETDKEDVVHTYNGILLSIKNDVMPFAAT